MACLTNCKAQDISTSDFETRYFKRGNSDENPLVRTYLSIRSKQSTIASIGVWLCWELHVPARAYSLGTRHSHVEEGLHT